MSLRPTLAFLCLLSIALFSSCSDDSVSDPGNDQKITLDSLVSPGVGSTFTFRYKYIEGAVDDTVTYRVARRGPYREKQDALALLEQDNTVDTFFVAAEDWMMSVGGLTGTWDSWNFTRTTDSIGRWDTVSFNPHIAKLKTDYTLLGARIDTISGKRYTTKGMRRDIYYVQELTLGPDTMIFTTEYWYASALRYYTVQNSSNSQTPGGMKYTLLSYTLK